MQHYIFLGGSMNELIGYVSQFATTLFGTIESGFKLFFNDLPVLFGLRLGWWFILFGILSLLYNYVTKD